MDGKTETEKETVKEKAILQLGDQQFELPVYTGSEGEKAIDIRKLRKESGHITLDPGYVNTGMTRSSICFIDGEEGAKVPHPDGVQVAVHPGQGVGINARGAQGRPCPAS